MRNGTSEPRSPPATARGSGPWPSRHEAGNTGPSADRRCGQRSAVPARLGGRHVRAGRRGHRSAAGAFPRTPVSSKLPLESGWGWGSGQPCGISGHHRSVCTCPASSGRRQCQPTAGSPGGVGNLHAIHRHGTRAHEATRSQDVASLSNTQPEPTSSPPLPPRTPRRERSGTCAGRSWDQGRARGTWRRPPRVWRCRSRD